MHHVRKRIASRAIILMQPVMNIFSPSRAIHSVMDVMKQRRGGSIKRFDTIQSNMGHAWSAMSRMYHLIPIS